MKRGELPRRKRNPLPNRPLRERIANTLLSAEERARRKLLRKIVPVTKEGMQELLSGRSTRYRYPINRAERKRWDRWWQYKGRGFTKCGKKLRNRDTKMQKESRKKNRRKK